ncbi:MAG: hypothetical protein AB2A00_19010 [Myxococcota bacterium]
MKNHGYALLLTALLSLACADDQLWEGETDDCTGNVQDFKVMLLLDSPMPPQPTGFVGKADDSQDDTWSVTEISDGSSMGPTLIIEATFNNGLVTEKWKLELSQSGPGTLEGELDADGNAGNVFNYDYKCDVKLERTH